MASTSNSHKGARRLLATALAIMALTLIIPTWMGAQDPQLAPDQLPQIKPQVPTANRNANGRVFLERADRLHKQTSDSFLILVGNVKFSRGPMLMFCDSAHYYPESESMNAFGNVRMEQGDTLFVYGDSLRFDGSHGEGLAKLYGNPVRMINRDVTLTTDTFYYDLNYDIGYYEWGGTLTDRQNRLSSIEGEYMPSTKEANFYQFVRLQSINQDRTDTLYIHTDTLYYNTDSHVAKVSGLMGRKTPSLIIDKGDTIFTTNGLYNTDNEMANLYDRSVVRMGRGTTLVADSLFYDRQAGYGEAFGNMVLTDSAKQLSLSGQYGYYNQLTDSAYVNGRPEVREYSQEDTLYLHAREIFSFTRMDTTHFPEDTVALTPAYFTIDTTHIIVAHPRVRFYRKDLQGICDSMRFEQKDSTLHMLRHPIVWSDDRQIFGNVIDIHLNDSTIERVSLPNFGFSAELIEGDFFNQLSGKEMVAYFEDGEMRRLDVNGNVEAIMLPMENDSTYNKIINVESSYLTADFEGKDLLRMKMWPETSGTVTPLYLAKKSLFFLPKFKWYTGMRPLSPEDIFIIPPEMEALMQEPEEATPVAKQTKQSVRK